VAPALLGRRGKARWYGARPVHEEETLAPTACVAERGVLFWSEPCRRVPARGDMVRAMLGDSWSRNVDAILHVLIGVPETDEMPDRRVCGDVAAARQALSAPPPPPPPPSPGAQTAAICLSLASMLRQQILTVPADHLLRHYGYCCCCCFIYFYGITCALCVCMRVRAYMMDSARHIYA
jgi:hypothetical protein